MLATVRLQLKSQMKVGKVQINEIVMRLLNHVLKVEAQGDDIKRMFRLGRRSERDRPLLIEFRNRQIKNLVMEWLGPRV